MTIRTMRAVAWMLVATVAVFTLSGCNNASIGMRLVNGDGGVCPITEVLVYPMPAEGQAPGPEAQVNRMPKDSSGSTVALLPDDQTMLPYLFQNDVLQVSVTFYDSKNQIFRQVEVPNPLDLTGVRRGSLVIFTAAMDKNNASTFKFEVLE